MQDFNVGDVVTIREWDEMAEEFGQRHDSALCKDFIAGPGPYAFISAMADYCGSNQTISAVRTVGGETVYSFVDTGYSWLNWMLKDPNADEDSDIAEASDEGWLEVMMA